MTTTKKRKSAPTRRHIELRVTNDTTPEEERRQKQNALISTEIQNLHVIAGAIPDSLKESSFDSVDMVQELRARAKAVQSGDLSQIEAMLITQAVTLEGLFSKLAALAMRQSHLSNIEGLIRPALKAQQQCTNTLKVLAEMKQPRQVAFVKQANIANNQQVNNGGTPTAHTLAHAHEENLKQSNELLEVIPHERMDTRAPSTASRIDPHLATVGEIDRAKD